MTTRPCASCGGTGGRAETTTTNGITRSTWRTCTSCGGAGTTR